MELLSDGYSQELGKATCRRGRQAFIVLSVFISAFHPAVVGNNTPLSPFLRLLIETLKVTIFQDRLNENKAPEQPASDCWSGAEDIIRGMVLRLH